MLERCKVRPWRLDDAPSLAKHANNRRIWLGLRDLFPHPYTVDDAKQFLQRATSAQPTTDFCIEIDGSAAGGIGIRIGEDVHRHTAELGYWLSEKFWGQGATSEAVTTFHRLLFREFSAPPHLRRAYANNPASLRVLEKAGFVLERTIEKERNQGRANSRFTSLRKDEVA